ncbi:MAG: hypothetical protein J5596_03380 [Bacteroidaceae bacterium]|nr:hypothetical protein [Bacteroidaceae bacterium]
MIKLRYILAVALLATFTPLTAQEGIEIKTPERIARMLESMPVSNIPQAGEFRCPELSGTVIFYTEAKNGITEQLGARLFSDGIRKEYDPVIISFVERLWAELLLRKTTASQASLLKEYGVRIVLGGYPLGSGSFARLGQALDVLNSLSSISITTGTNEIDMFMRDNAGSTMHIYIPASRDLLFPFDKKEHEERLIKDLQETKHSYSLPDKTEGTITASTDDYFVMGGDCYMIDSLCNDIFFDKNGRSLWDPQKYPEQSMRNIMMGAVPLRYFTNMTLDIRPHTYNREIKSFKMPFERFIGYMQQQGCRFYTGDLGRDGNRCQCLMAMYHPVYNYLHILSVSFTPDQLEADDQVTIKADLSVFIPQHNIKNLFQEK